MLQIRQFLILESEHLPLLQLLSLFLPWQVPALLLPQRPLHEILPLVPEMHRISHLPMPVLIQLPPQVFALNLILSRDNSSMKSSFLLMEQNTNIGSRLPMEVS